ncbi:hypothetical protein HPG69_016472, partial [Diceros bicornis minor]
MTRGGYLPWSFSGPIESSERGSLRRKMEPSPFLTKQHVYPTTMRALGMGTSGSLCRIGAMVAPFIAQVRPRSLCREDEVEG